MESINIELGVLNDGTIMLVSDKPLPSIVKKVEFFQEPQLLLLHFFDASNYGLLECGELMHYEVPLDFVSTIIKANQIIIYALFDDHEPIGYRAPLEKV